jgi:fructan beta-fructosidase
MRRTWLGGVVVVLLLAGAAAPGDRADILVADFEGDDYGGWKAEGTAFGTGPARGTLPGQMPVGGFHGRGLVNSFTGGDGATGRLTSPAFKLERKYLTFLIGGGKHPGKTCLNLLVAGKIVRTATGPNDRPGWSEMLAPHQWDVAEFAGKSAVLEIVDDATGGWGHINVDHIVQSDRRLPQDVVNARREIAADGRYLNLPVKHKAPRRRMSILVDGQPVREFEIELADAEPDYWVFLDLQPFRGKTLTLQVDRLPEGSQALKRIETADTVRGAENLYSEKLRPQFHFSSRRGWNNDPNGMVYHQGEYHLYYQHNPYGWDWGNMHWGHAVSADLVHWRELPIALYPRRFGDWCFSGSAVVDQDNASGFKTGDETPIVVAYTSTGRGECIAYSNDRGRTFTEFAGNPVVKHRGRDPKLLWYAPGKHWVMVVYDEAEGKARDLAFYTSADLKTWQYRSRLGGYFECPELFELPVDGDPKNTRWVVYAADNEYCLGKFDGKIFSPIPGRHKGAQGDCLYAAQTFSNAPDGRRIQIGWARIATPGMPFNQMMTFPVELTLRTTDDGVRMFANPVREIEKLHAKKHAWKDVAPPAGPLPGVDGELFHIKAEFDPRGAGEVGLDVRGVPVVYDAKKQMLTCGKASAPLKAVGGKVRLEILADRTSLEIFANDGRVYLPVGVTPAASARGVRVITRGNPPHVTSLEIYELRSAWK